MNKRKFALLLALVVLFQFVPILPQNQTSASTYSTATANYDGTHAYKYYTSAEWTQLKIDYNIPALTPSVNSKNLPFNMELWIEKGITVYGDYSAVPSALNTFKSSTLTSGNVVIPNKGYYENGTGEYRYHGYDANNSLYANNNLPRDADSGTKPTEKNWIYQIWKPTNQYYSTNRVAEASIYNKVALGINPADPKDKSKIQNWINTGLPFNITNSTNADKTAYHYAHVQTAPTTRSAGETLLYHISKMDGKPWYQVFSLNPIKSKEITPVEATITILGQQDIINNGKADKQYKVKVEGLLLDDSIYKDEILKTSRYTRDDIDSWSMELTDNITGQKQTLIGKRDSKEKGSVEFTVVIPYATYEPYLSESSQNISPIFTGKATSIFTTGDKSSDTATVTFTTVAPIIDEKDAIQINITAPHEMLDTERFKIVDSTTGDDFVRTVELNGKTLSDTEADSFLSGSYLFPLVGEDRIYTYNVIYDDNVKKVKYEFMNYIVVYTTKPKAQISTSGTFKENRLINATADVGSVNSSYLKTNASISPILFNATTSSGNDGLIKYGTKNINDLAFIVKGQEQVNIQIQANAIVNPSKIERSDIPSGYHTSDLYTYTLFTLEDYAPSLIANIWNGTLTRNETLDFYYEASSTDNDMISVNTYKILFDNNNDGTFETIIKQGNYDTYTAYNPTSLGNYKVIFYAEESFGQPTLALFITEDDKRTFAVEREFRVDNLAPMTKLFTDIEYDFPQADVIVLNDQAITRELNNSIVSERVNWINSIRQSSVDATVQVWDLYTYVNSQSASTTLNTGSSTPPATIPYSSGGYTGTLYKYNTVNNQYQVDNGYYTTVADSRTEYQDVDNTSGGNAVYKYSAGGWSMVSGWSGSSLPSSRSYSSGGYTGTLNLTGATDYSDPPPSGKGTIGETYYRQFYWVGHYSGTVSKQVQVWQSNWVWLNEYTGYYSGTIYKSIKQIFTPSFRISSNKYLVYFADSNINNLTDIQAIKSKGTVKMILIGTSATKSQIAYDYYINSSKSLTDIMSEINTIITNENPYENKQLVQVGETFTIQSADYDLEGDPLTIYGYQYLHDANYYDNGMGLESGAVATYSDGSFTITLKNSFSKVGHYKVLRKIKDIPAGYSSYTKDSNIPSLDIYVHRKPIADFTLDWDYVSASAAYTTTWVDKSYDLDHQYSDAQKGIVERKIMYRKTSGDNLWVYAIPENLTAGTYELRYTVKDLEGTWSDEITKSFVLSAEPPIRITGDLRALEPKFHKNAIPASEILEIFNLQTQYHRAHQLRIQMINQEGQTLREEALLFSLQIPNYNIYGNLYKFANQTAYLAETLPDGNYIMRLTATAVQAPLVSKALDLPFTVFTPITIKGKLGPLIVGESVTISAETNQYAKSASVTLFEGTSFEKTIELEKMEDGESILWKGAYKIPENMPEGNYNHQFVAKTPSGKQATEILVGKVDTFAIQKIELIGYWNHWRGQIDAFGNLLTLDPHRFLSYEKVRVVALVNGNPDKVIVHFSPELQAMTFTNSLGQHYAYRDELGYEVTFPIQMEPLIDHPENANGRTMWSIEYVLPLCKPTLSWDNQRTKQPYFMTVEAIKGGTVKKSVIDDIEITGNIYDLMYVQPNYK